MIRFSKRIALLAAAASFCCAGPAFATEARYGCDGGTTLEAQFSPPNLADGRVTLRFGDGTEIVLPQVPSADGGRYAGGGVEFWIKGRGATLTRGGTSRSCQAR